MIGLVGGLGVGAAIHYYRELAAAHDEPERPLNLAMSHASVTRVSEYASQGDRQGLADYLATFLSRLKSAGATIGVVPAVTPHLCIDELKAITPLPLIDITQVVSDHIRRRKLSKVALFGTRFVVESDLFGRLQDVDVVRPQPAEVNFIHDAYTNLARTGVARDEDRERFVKIADTLHNRDGVEAIVLAGTDLSVMFNPSNTPFPHVDCAAAHIDAIVSATAG
jgi:aspartate racemase